MAGRERRDERRDRKHLLRRLGGVVADRRRAEGLFQGLLESAPDAVIVVDDQGHIVLVNRQAEVMFGHAREDVLGRPVELLVPQRFHDRHSSHRDRYAEERRVRPMGAGLELFGVRADGTEFPVEISLSPVDTEGRLLVFASVRDVTGRRDAEEERARLVAIVESSEDAIFAKALDGTIQSWNRGAERIYGYPRREAIGRPIMMLAPPDRPDEIPAIMDRVRRGESVEHHETVRVRKDGKLIEVAITVSPIRDPSGTVVGASVVSRDVTERRRAEAAQILQRSLLPERLPTVPGVNLAGRYVAAGTTVDVGGDWYDALVLPYGRLCLAIGDVTGKGVRAASLMGQLRDALRALAYEGYTPARVLSSLNGLASEVARAVATCLCLYLEPQTGRAMYAGAGHPPPLVRMPDGTTHVLEPTGDPPLGTLARHGYADHELHLGPGSVVFMYTDGLVERRGEAIDVGIGRLRAIVEGGVRDIEVLADRALAEVGPEGGLVDDVAVLAASLEPVGAVLQLEIDVDQGELSQMRQAMRRWLFEHEVGEEDTYRIVLAANEACANAIEHGYGFGEEPISVRSEIDAGGIVRVAVRDRGTWRPPRGSDRGHGLTLMRGLVDDVEISSGPGGTEVMLRARASAREPLAGA